MPDQVTPTLTNTQAPPATSTGSGQSLDDILNELEKQYNVPAAKDATPSTNKPVETPKPVTPPPTTPVPPPVKPLAEPPKFEVKEHTISTEPKVDKVKPVTAPVIEQTEMKKPEPAPVTPPQEKGAGFAAMQQTVQSTPNEFDQPKTAPAKEEVKAGTPPTPPKPKGGVSNLAKVLGGVVGVLMLVAGTFAVNKLVTQPQDIRQQASGNCGPDSSPCTPGGWHYFCGAGEQPQKRHCDGSTFCWDTDTEDNGAACSGGQVCRSGSCVDPNPSGQCTASVSGDGTVLDFSASDCVGKQWSATLYVCSSRACGNHPQYGVCHTACDPTAQAFTYGPGTIDSENWTNRLDARGKTNIDCKLIQFDGAINIPGGQATGHTIWDDLRPDCGQTANITCSSKIVTTADNCTDLTDCSPGANITGSMVYPGQELLYVLSTTAATGSPQNVTFTDVLPAGIDWVGSGSAGCTYNAGNRTVTCLGGNFTNGQQWGPIFKVKVAANIAAGDHNNTATLTATGVTATTCSANIKTVNSSVISCEYKKAYKGSSCAIEDGCQFNAADEIANNSTVQAGDTIIYRLRTTPYSEMPGTNLRFTDVLDSKLEWDPTFQSTGCTYNSANRTVTCLNEGSLIGIEGQWWAAFKVKVATSASGNIPNTANFTYDQQPGGQTSSCSVTLSVPETPIACVGLTITPAVPQLGDNVTITCGDASSLGVNRYEFGYTSEPEGTDSNPRVWTEVQPVAAGSRISAPFNVSTSGTYNVRCRACKNTECTNWDIQ